MALIAGTQDLGRQLLEILPAVHDFTDIGAQCTLPLRQNGANADILAARCYAIGSAAAWQDVALAPTAPA